MKKVTARQLMIGDWVKYNKEYRQVRKLSTTEMRLSVKNDEYLCLICSSATPIPITEEVITQIKHSLRNSPISVGYSESEEHLWITNFVHPTNHYWGIQYIHQLQQAYRLATNKELKVKF